MANISELNQYGKNITGFKVGRSRFPLDNENVLTLKAGDIVPVRVDEVLPGDTFQIGFTFVMRMLTPVSPIMDNCFLDWYSFFIPSRLLSSKYNLTSTDEDFVEKPEEYGNWQTFFTENEHGAWTPDDTTYLKLYKPNYMVAPQSVLDYLGYPLFTSNNATSNLTFQGNKISEMIQNISDKEPINGFKIAGLDLIYNDWFRNENLEAPTIFRQNGEISAYSTTTRWQPNKVGNTGYINPIFEYTDGYVYKSGSTEYDYEYPYKATKFSDMFTNALPDVYKIDPEIVLGLAGTAPVVVNGTIKDLEQNIYAAGTTNPYESETYSIATQGGTDKNVYAVSELTPNDLHSLKTTGAVNITLDGTTDLTEATAITVNQLREAITIQHIAEAFARGGTRYSEILHAIYGTAPDDVTLERPELLGAKRFPVNTTQVVNSAITSSGDLGELGAYSHTVGSDKYIVSKSFKEHGYIFTVCVIRTSNKYYQGIPKDMSKHRLFDFYFPQFAGLGDQAVLNKEIFMSGDSEVDNEVFGYQEAFYEYHYKKDELHGLVNPVSGDVTLASYTYQIPFSTTPTLSKEFDTQSAESIGNVLYDTKTISQFLLDIYFEANATREMPVHAIPGVDRI